MSEGASRPSIIKIAGLVLACLTAVHVVYYFPRCVDDLFISLRFAENLSHGRGIVFNVGERVEGYSSPLWMLLQAIGFVFHFEGVTWTKLLGIASLGAVIAGVHRFCTELLEIDPRTALVASLMIVLDSYVVAWSVLGLETPAFLALLVWFPIVVRRQLDAPSRRRAWIAGSVAVALALVRPEAPLYIGAMGLAELAARRPDASLKTRFLRGVRLALPVLAVLGVLLVARRLYFGLWLPHTYYVKGSTAGFELAKLAPLVDEGAGKAESLYYLGGVTLAAAIAITRKRSTPTIFAAMACSLFFTASVERDWMPSLRHLLPIAVFATIAWTALIDRVSRFAPLREWGFYVAGVIGFVLVATGIQIAKVDVRMSLIDRGKKPWAVHKTDINMHDAWVSLRGDEPPHVAGLGTFEMGLITQNYRVIEASADPVEDSWYIGRDIGQVGFYTGIRVFDTPGLFTHDVVADAASGRDRAINGPLIRKAFARAPVAAEILDFWTPALARESDLQTGYSLVNSAPSWPVDLVQSTRPLPSSEEILRRYEQSLAKFPQWFCLATLYGESAGGAMRRRVRIVRELVAAQTEAAKNPPPELDREHGAGAILEGTMESLGCELSPATIHAGEQLRVRCAWRALAVPTETYLTFMHFDDAHGNVMFQEDHPEGAFHPTRDWRPGEVVQDFGWLIVPKGLAPGPYRLHFGMYKREHRPAVTPPSMSDGKDRVAGPTLLVVP